ncbi:hypothetical protein EV421DRAFT_1904608 [Armillaria borealis]|uniref:EF-hand domain-containing protein n=1 Tax=Armillaria borealis TaxID=47425 RepID=A0AA39JFQ9_9AGAR|nr:hypothetical protein EV421DRAFT_1904608 [Armillaria borealis]
MKKLRAIVRIVLHPFRRRPNVSRNIDKTGDALNLNVPSGAQPDTDVGSKDIPGASNAIDGDPGDAGPMDVSHTDIDKADDTLNPNIPSDAQIDTDVGSKVISRIPNDIDHDPDAIYSLEESKVERPLQMYLGFGDVSEVLLDGLGLLAEVHPVSKAVFLSFKAAVKLGTMYQVNNKKVGILRLRVQDLLIAIFQLRRVKKSQEISPDSKTVNIMETVMKDIAGHISRAASDCNLYMEKLTILRVFGSIKYESVLTDHVATLAADRNRLMTTLQIRTTIEVESMERTLVSLKADVKKILRHLDTPEEKGFRDILEKKGDTSAYILQSIGDDSVDVRGHQLGLDFRRELQKEIDEDIKKASEKHWKRFEGNWERLEKLMPESNKEKNSVADRIIDVNFRELWTDMDWRKVVEAKFFVSVLYEHLIEKLGDHSKGTSSEDDRWMLDYLNSAHLQPLLEAVDDDDTGFITTKEINTFVESKLETWTIFQWIVYWAAGWQYSVAQYKRSIYMLISAMYSIYPRVLPANRGAFIRYLRDDTIFKIDKLLQSTHGPPSKAFESGELRRLTKEFTEAEEKHLTDKLKQVQYDIYAPYIVSLVTGEGLDKRLENLESKFKQSNVGVGEKLNSFAFGMFKLYQENPEKDLSSNEISKYIYEHSYFDGDIQPPDVALHASDLLHKPLNEAPLCFPLSLPQAVDFKNPIQGRWSGQMYSYGRSRFGLMQLSIESSPRGVLTGVAVTCQYIMKISGKIRRNKKVIIRLDFEDSDGDYDSEVLTGRLDAERGIIHGCWDDSDEDEDEDSEEEEEENSDAEENKDEVHRNDIVAASEEDTDEEAGSSAQQDELNAIDSGSINFEPPPNPVDAGFQVSGEGDTFVFRRTPAPLWRFLPSRPPDSSMAVESLAHARWSFASKCVLDRIRRENSPERYLVERFTEAGRFLVLARRKLYHAEYYCPRLNDLSIEEEEELERLKSAICPEFIRPYYYAFVTDVINRHIHTNYGCDCYTVDLCASCVEESVDLRGFIHEASHDLLKCDTLVLDVHWQWIIPRARSMVVRIKEKFRSRSKIHTEPAERSDLLDNSTQSKKKLSNVTESSLPPKCQGCHKEVSLPCCVRISYWAFSEEYQYLCGTCESESKLPSSKSPEFGLPLLRINEDDAPEEVVTIESRLAVLERKFEKFDQQLSAMTKLLGKVTGNSISDV